MIPLNKIPDPDKVLPENKTCSRHYNTSPNICDCGAKGFNQAIDQYNQVMIDGDVERLARLIHANRSVESWETCSVGDRDCAWTEAEEYIANLDKFLMLKKRLIEK